MAVHFMFAASKQFESVPVEGDSIALWQLKDEIFNVKFRAAMEKRRVKERFDFRVYYAESKEEIVGADTRVARHSRVVVKRLPAYVVSEVERQQQQIANPNPRVSCPIDDGFGDDVFSTPAAASPVKQPVASVVRSDRKQPAAPRVRSDRNQAVAVNRSESSANSAMRSSDVMLDASVVTVVPRDLACSVCQDFMKDAVLIPCCCTSFCRACVTGALLAHHKCPSCNSSKCKPSDVLPNRSLNASIELHHKANGTLTSMSSTSSCSSAQSGLSSEHKRSESTYITAANPGELSKLPAHVAAANPGELSKLPAHVAAANPGEKSKLAAHVAAANPGEKSKLAAHVAAANPGEKRKLAAHVAAANHGEKRKLAPLSIPLVNAKRTKPLIISLAPKALVVT